MSEREFFGQDDDLPPVVAEPVRRDPSISITRDARPPRTSPPQLLGGTLGLHPNASKITKAFALTVGVLASLVLSGVLAHAVFWFASAVAHAIMIGWNVWP